MNHIPQKHLTAVIEAILIAGANAVNEKGKLCPVRPSLRDVEDRKLMEAQACLAIMNFTQQQVFPGAK